MILVTYVCIAINYRSVSINRERCQSYLWSAEEETCFFFIFPRSRLIFWSRETGSVVPSRVSLRKRIQSKSEGCAAAGFSRVIRQTSKGNQRYSTVVVIEEQKNARDEETNDNAVAESHRPNRSSWSSLFGRSARTRFLRRRSSNKLSL